MRSPSAIASLRVQIALIEGQSRHEGCVLPFGLPVLDAKLSSGGLALGALHEVAGGGRGAVVAEVAALNMTASRRLQLAVEGKRTIGIALRRWRRQADAADFGQPTIRRHALTGIEPAVGAPAGAGRGAEPMAR